MPPAALKTCKTEVWHANQKVPCGEKYKGDLCPSRDLHIMKMKTGFCSSGWCEGVKAKDWKGRPVKTCAFFMTCPCDCHEMLWRMAAMTDTERMLHDNPEYVRPKPEFWTPADDSENWKPISHADEQKAILIASPSPEIVPPTLVKPFTPTVTGRAARGELESWVKEQCDIWLIEGYKIACTPVWISEQIGLDKAIKEPSVGAIGAVFDRWIKLGFAVIEKKPTRFIQYTEEGVRLGLDRMKEQAKRKAKLIGAEQKRKSVR